MFFLKQEKATDSVGGGKFQGFSFKHRANWYFDKVIYKISEINWITKIYLFIANRAIGVSWNSCRENQYVNIKYISLDRKSVV